MTHSTIIVDYDAGNLRSVQRACARVGMEAEITADPERLLGAERVIFPGVGSAESAVDTLQSRGLFDALIEYYRSGRPLLGICLGSQIVLEYTEEGRRDCLGLVEGVCKRFDFTDRTLKVPHIGWNEVEVMQSHPMLDGIDSGDEFYFVHSYHAVPDSDTRVYGVTDYGLEFCSMLGQDNLFATQFHLEKSGRMGLAILARFKDWDGSC